MNSRTLYFRLLSHVYPYWRIFLASLLGMVAVALTEPAMPALLKPLLDEGFVAQEPFMMYLMPMLLIVLAFVRGIATFISNVGITWVASRVVMDLRQAMFGRLLVLPTSQFDNLSAGVLLSKFTYDVNRVMQASTEVLVVLVRDSVSVLGLLAWMIYLNWQLSLIMLTVLPLIALSVRQSGIRLRRLNLELQTYMGSMTRVLEESVGGHKLIKVFSGQNYESQRFQDTSNAVRQHEVKIKITSNFNMFVVQMLTALVLAVIIYIAVRQSTAGQVSVGGFVSLFTAMGMLFAPIKRLTKVNEHIQQGLAAAQSVFELIDEVPEADFGSCQPIQARGEIELRGVRFEYETGHPVLHDVNLHIQAGQTIAFVGASGSGKSTLANLLPRFYPLKYGTILLDGINIYELPLAVLRDHIALVSQEIVLFNDTVAANIAYGAMNGADRAQIIAAAEAAHAWEFVSLMPQGLDTIVGEHGVKLSGGQRQRIAIARALLKNAPILIFDEATSALDTRSERYVQASLEKLKQGRTTLIIAHRLSTIEQADQIVVMAQGRIVETGTHAELMSQNGMYAQLYRAQR